MTPKTKIEIFRFFLKNHWSLLVIFVFVQLTTGRMLSGDWPIPQGVSLEAIQSIHSLTANLIGLLTMILVITKFYLWRRQKNPS